jgi:hypothetical protein
MQFSPIARHFISLRSKYSPQHPVLKHGTVCVAPSMSETKTSKKVHLLNVADFSVVSRIDVYVLVIVGHTVVSVTERSASLTTVTAPGGTRQLSTSSSHGPSSLRCGNCAAVSSCARPRINKA